MKIRKRIITAGDGSFRDHLSTVTLKIGHAPGHADESGGLRAGVQMEHDAVPWNRNHALTICFHAMSRGKVVSTLPGIALDFWPVSKTSCGASYRTQETLADKARISLTALKRLESENRLEVYCAPPLHPPSLVETDIHGGAIRVEVRERILATIPLGRPDSPEDVGGACLFLASDLSAFVTGATIDVNAGQPHLLTSPE